MNPKKIKVLHISHSLDTGGGPLAIKKAVEDLGDFEHYVAGNDGHYFDLFHQTLGSQQVLKLRGKNLFKNERALDTFVRKNRIQLIHCHGRGAGIYGRILKVMHPRIKIIYTVHGFHPETVKWPVRAFYLVTERLLLPLTDRVILVSASELQRFQRYIHPGEKKISLIPNYLKAEDNKKSETHFRLDDNFINLCYIGRLAPEKGIDILIDAFARLKRHDVRLYLIGYGPMEQWVSRRIEESELQHYVSLLGKINGASAHMWKFDAIVVPSRFEGMPFVCLEAMLSRTSIIATPAVGITDVVSPDTAYLSTDFTPAALHDAICRFLNDARNNASAIEEKKRRNSIKLASEFSDTNIKKLNDLYQQVIEG